MIMPPPPSLPVEAEQGGEGQARMRRLRPVRRWDVEPELAHPWSSSPVAAGGWPAEKRMRRDPGQDRGQPRGQDGDKGSPERVE
jgi:hypothetical protein